MSTLTLIMIVKNESKIIERCMESIRGKVDYIVISDTGSTDGTPTIITNYLVTHSIRGKVYHDSWKNFGHNRTKSVRNAQEWLADNNINKETNYFITIDADMVIKFLPSFSINELSSNLSWLIQQKNDTINYYNLRIFRSDLPYKCIGVTHEYWGCDGNITEGRLDSVYIDDRGDGGCKADKFTRDIALLTKGLEDEPNNERYFFYLAQSYSDSGDVENGLKWYKRCINAGGWEEEIFISHKQRGELFMRKGEDEKAICEWIKAYECMPERSETLYRIIQHYRLKGNNMSALLFLRTALSIPYPEKYVLFIEHPIYDYKLVEEFSIIAYYIGKRKEGNIACQMLLLNKSVPDYIKDGVMSNSYFYIPRLNWTRHSIIHTDAIPEPYKSSSACFFLDTVENTISGVVRAVNYSMDDRFNYTMRDTKGIVRTKNFWLSTSASDYSTPVIREIVCSEHPENPEPVRNSHIKGFEDIRICRIGDDLFGIAVHWEYGRLNHPSVVYFSMKGNYVIDRVKPIRYRDEICQKNWVLYSENEKLYAVYSHHPLTILELDTKFVNTERVVMERYSPYDLSRTRGSSIPVRVGNDYLFLTHEVIPKDTRKYYHRFLRYDNEWNLKGVSEPFYLNNFYVEFSLSIMYNRETDTLLIPFSTRDNTTEIVEMSYSSVNWLPLDNIYKNMNQWLKDNI
jgi:glycosyltransferase involved in cell wall biosynthesis